MVQLQYQALGLTDSFDEKETAACSPVQNGNIHGRSNGKGGEGGGEGWNGGRAIKEGDLFDDPKYVSLDWVETTVNKALVSESC